MISCVAVLALLAAAPPPGEAPVSAPAVWRPLPQLALSSLPPEASTRDAGAPPPACSGDVCQPRVAVPGFEPRISLRGKRTELVLALLDHAHVEPLATVVWMMAATGLRLDYTPATFDPGGVSYGHGGWGHLQVLLRWRIDALNAPVWPVRQR